MHNARTTTDEPQSRRCRQLPKVYHWLARALAHGEMLSIIMYGIAIEPLVREIGAFVFCPTRLRRPSSVGSAAEGAHMKKSKTFPPVCFLLQFTVVADPVRRRQHQVPKLAGRQDVARELLDAAQAGASGET